MKRNSLLLTTILVAACSSDGRKANPSEQQAANGFVQSALSISGSFDAQNAMPALPIAFGFMPNGTAGCVTRVGDHLTFNCTEDGVTVTGTLSRDGDHVTMDLHATGRISLDFTGDFTANASEINGTLEMRASAEQVSVRADATYDHIKLDAARCPVAGRLRFAAEATANGKTQSRDLEVGFGPACGDVTIFD
jgi:hypothetical protein